MQEPRTVLYVSFKPKPVGKVDPLGTGRVQNTGFAGLELGFRD